MLKKQRQQEINNRLTLLKSNSLMDSLQQKMKDLKTYQDHFGSRTKASNLKNVEN